MKRATVIVLLALLALAAWWIWLRPRPSPAGGDLYPWSVEQLRAVDMILPGRSFRVEIADGAWRLTAPVRDQADSGEIGRMLATLHFEEIDSLLPLPPRSQWSDWGLDPPDLELRLTREEGVDTLRFGSLDAGAGRLRVQASWSDSLMLVSTLLRSNFLANRYKLSEKRVLPLESWRQVESLSVESERGRFAVRPGHPEWQLVASETYLADREAVLQYLAHLASPLIIDFLDMDAQTLDRLGLRYPQARLKVEAAGRLLPLELAVGHAASGRYFAWMPEREAVFLLDSLAVAPLMRPFGVWLSPRLFQLGAWELLSVEGPGGRMERADEKGRQWRDGQGRVLVREQVTALLMMLEGLSAETVESYRPRQDQLKAWGLMPPLQVYEMEADHGRYRLEVGKLLDGRRYFRRPDYPPVYSLPADELPLFWPEPEAGPGR